MRSVFVHRIFGGVPFVVCSVKRRRTGASNTKQMHGKLMRVYPWKALGCKLLKWKCCRESVAGSGWGIHLLSSSCNYSATTPARQNHCVEGPKCQHASKCAGVSFSSVGFCRLASNFCDVASMRFNSYTHLSFIFIYASILRARAHHTQPQPIQTFQNY